MKYMDLLLYWQLISATQLYSSSSLSESRTRSHLSGLAEYLQTTTQFTPAAAHEHLFVHLLLIHVQYCFAVAAGGLDGLSIMIGTIFTTNLPHK